MKKLPNVASLIIINLIPIVGVFYLGWNIYQLIIIFWTESVLAGVFNLIKMAFARKPTITDGYKTSKIGTMLFFCIHYFGFIFVLGLLNFAFVIDLHKLNIGNFHFKQAFVWLFLGFSSNLIGNFISNGKFLITSAAELFFAPYGRIWILAVLIFSGAYIVKSGIKQETFYLFIMVGVKLLVDIIAYYLSDKVLKIKDSSDPYPS